MTTSRRLRRSNRRGYAMIMVLVFLALMLSGLAVTQRRLSSVLRVEAGFAKSHTEGDRKRAMGRALDVLWTGLPPSDPFICKTLIDTSAGPVSYTITYDKRDGNHWRVFVEPTAPGDDPPLLPASF